MKPQRVLLLTPPDRSLENTCSVPPLGLLYLTSILKQKGHEVTIKRLQNLTELTPRLEDTDFIGISTTTPAYTEAIHMLNYVKREAPEIPVAIGGPHVTAIPREAIRNGFDLVVRGEGDEIFPLLVESTSPQSQIYDAGYVRDLDLLPFPDRSAITNEGPFRPFLCRNQDPALSIASMLLSRGCPYRCKFCGPHYPYRRRSAANVEAELVQLKKEGYDGVVIIDDLPFCEEEDVISFCGSIRPLGLLFRCNFRSDLMTPRIARILRGSGCRRVQIGIESADDATLDVLHKGTTSAVNGRAVEICRDEGLEVKAMAVWGLPTDNAFTADKLVRWVQAYRPDSFQLSMFCPLPGSPLWRHEGRSVVDYRSLSFFPPRDTENHCNQKFLPLYHAIRDACSRITHLDTGVVEVAHLKEATA